jgi:hypothetical protein
MYFHDTNVYLWSDVTNISVKRLPTNGRPFQLYSHILFPASTYIYHHGLGLRLPQCEPMYPPVVTEDYDSFLTVASIELNDGRAFIVVSVDGEAPHEIREMYSYRMALSILGNLSLWWSPNCGG